MARNLKFSPATILWVLEALVRLALELSTIINYGSVKKSSEKSLFTEQLRKWRTSYFNSTACTFRR